MIFTRPHLALIQAGQKTQTRRLGRKRWRVGAVHPIKVGWYDKPAGCIRILSVAIDRPGNTTREDALEEGYPSIAAYREAWERIYRRHWRDDLPVHVITFCLADGPEKYKQATLFDEEESLNGLPDHRRH